MEGLVPSVGSVVVVVVVVVGDTEDEGFPTTEVLLGKIALITGVALLITVDEDEEK